MSTHLTNKEIVRSLYKRAVAQGDLAYANEIIAEDYIQHSKSVKPGKAGIMEALAYMKTMPKPANAPTPVIRLIAEDDYVVTHFAVSFGSVKKVVTDLFRLRDGKITEHWDVMQDEPATSANGVSMTDGPIGIEDVAHTVKNKKVIEKFYKEIVAGNDLQKLALLVSSDVIQHDAEISNGVEGWQSYLLPRGSHDVALNKLIAEGNFAALFYEDVTDGMICMELFRLTGNKVAEHWRVRQKK